MLAPLAPVITIVLVLELILRSFGPVLPGSYRTGPLIEPDAALGWRHIPDAVTWYRYPEFVTKVVINEQGRPGQIVAETKTPGVLRIALLGDSMAEAAVVPIEAGLAELLVQGLADLGPVEVINEGVSSYGTDQAVLAFERRVAPLRPDAVVLLFTVANDVWNNDWALESQSPTRVKPHFGLDTFGAAVLDPTEGTVPLGDTLRSAVARSAVVSLVKSGIIDVLGQRDPRAAREAQWGVLREPTGEWVRAWQITDAILARLAADAKAAGVPLLLAIAPDNCQVHIVDCGRFPELNASTVPQRILAASADRWQIPVLDLLVPFRVAAAGPRRLHLTADIHWNAEGYRLAARSIIPALRTALRSAR